MEERLLLLIKKFKFLHIVKVSKILCVAKSCLHLRFQLFELLYLEDDTDLRKSLFLSPPNFEVK